uniref:Serine carboxypeptidase n=1 Tax=Panagrolaimus sp. JU765 TaxID=591449 RepID=A0AC34QGF4_9BILA
MLGAKISEDKAFPAKLKGIAIGNGFMNVKMLTNSLILWSNYHGRFSLDLYNIDPYNYYEDCYAGSLITYFGKPRRESYLNWKAAKDATYHNTADLMNRDSTDPLWGYPCFQEDYVAGYFNKPEVQDAFHIDPAWRQANLTFADCNNNLYNNYKLTYDDMQPYFETMIKNLADFHILIYNGDVDTVCNFLGDARFIDKVASANGFTHGDRQRWNFRRQLAGFYQRYTRAANNFVIDVLTVKGAGHMVPLDRPGPSLQMITNFLKNNDYNIGNSIDATAQPQPLLNIGTTTGKSGATLSAFSFVLSSAIFVLFLQI